MRKDERGMELDVEAQEGGGSGNLALLTVKCNTASEAPGEMMQNMVLQ